MKLHHHILTALPLFFCLLPVHAAHAGVSKPSSPGVQKGTTEIEYSATRYGDNSAALNNKQSHTYEAEYGFTDRFKLGIEAQSERQSPHDNRLSGYGVEAQYVLTTQANAWLDSAIKGEYVHASQEGDADEVEIKLLAAYNVGATKLVANLNFGHEIGSNRSKSIDLGSKLQIRQRLNAHLNPGLEWHADYGKINNLGDDRTQEHYIGPTISGDIFAMGDHSIDYTFGYFWGLTNASANNAVRVQLGYEFAF